MIGEGRIFKERQRERVICPEFGKEVSKGSLVAHHQTQNGVAKGRLGQKGNEATGGNRRQQAQDLQDGVYRKGWT